MCRYYQIVIFDHEIVDWCYGKIQLQRLPVRAVIKRYEDMPSSVPAYSRPLRLGSSRTAWTYAPSGIPVVIALQFFPRSVVLKMYGLKSSSLCRSTATYAVLPSCGEASMILTVLHSGIWGVTFDQCCPSSVVT